jgi:hypothetical protein
VRNEIFVVRRRDVESLDMIEVTRSATLVDGVDDEKWKTDREEPDACTFECVSVSSESVGRDAGASECDASSAPSTSSGQPSPRAKSVLRVTSTAPPPTEATLRPMNP